MCRKVISLLIAVCMIFTGCTFLKPGGDFEEVSRRLLKLRSYTCDVTMRVANNKSMMEYKLKHYFKSPDKYKVEVLEPKELKGQITIYNGNSSYIYHPQIEQYLITENFSDSVEYNSFIGSFMEHIKKTDDIKISSEKNGDRELFIVEFDIPESNNYMRHEKIWFDAEDIVPLKAEIYGNDGTTCVQIRYSNFVYNPDLKDRDFEITKNSMKLQEMKENVRSEENQGCMGGSGPGCTCPQHEGSKEACTEGCPCNRSN